MKAGFCRLAVAFALATAGAGCVAVNVGKPETFTNTQTVTETATVPSSWAVSAARGRAEQSETRLAVGIDADVLEGYARTQYEETVVVRRQKRLSVGLFPAAAERFLMPDGALDSGEGFYYDAYMESPRYYSLYAPETSYATKHFLCILTVGVPYVTGTLNSLLFQPFAGWACSHDYLDKGRLKPNGMNPYRKTPYLDDSESPKLLALDRFPAGERRKIGVKTCLDGRRTDAGMATFFTHMGIVGCHKYLAVFVDPVKRGPGQEAKAKTQSRRADVEGPFVAEVEIPALGWTRTARVGKGATRAEFSLPAAERKCVAEAVVRFRADGAGAASEVTKGALEKVAGGEYRFDVTLEGGAGAGAAVPAAVSKAAGGAYEVVGISRLNNGQYEVRVKIADKSRTFDVGWAVEPDVKRMIREDFAKRHPGTGIQYVREMVEWETEEDGAILVYRGWAFSARPVSDGWAYDDESRRGMVRLRISEGMPAEEAKRWARENIEAIVKEKNVALEAGKAPPEGAVYRSLGESLEDGVLTVEFEAAE